MAEPYRDPASPFWENLINEIKEGKQLNNLSIITALLAAEAVTTEKLGALAVTTAKLANAAASAAKIAQPGWVVAASQEKVETPASTVGFEVAKVNSEEFRTRGVWKTTAEIPTKTQFMTLKAESIPAAERAGQLNLVVGAAEKLTVIPFNILATGKIENIGAIPTAAFINFNGGWYNA